MFFIIAGLSVILTVFTVCFIHQLPCQNVHINRLLLQYPAGMI